MKVRLPIVIPLRFLLCIVILFLSAPMTLFAQHTAKNIRDRALKRYLYVAVPGIRNYLGYGGHGILVFDINHQHRFVRRISTGGLHPDKTPSNVKGIAVSIALNSVYVSTIESLQRIDLSTDDVIWEKPFEGGCDRMSISPDGKTMYLPSFEKGFWNVVDCATGNIIKKSMFSKEPTIQSIGPAGTHVYLGDIASPWL